MISTLVRLTGLSPLLLKLIGTALVVAVIAAAFALGEAKGTRNERNRNTASLAKAETAMRRAEIAGRNLADALAAERATQNAKDTEQLHDAAKTGTNDAVGRGIGNVLDRLSEQQRPR